MHKIEKAKAAFERSNASFNMASRLLADQIRENKVGAAELYAWLSAKTALDASSDEWTAAVVERGHAYFKKRSSESVEPLHGPHSNTAANQTNNEWSGTYRGHQLQVARRSMAPGFSILTITVGRSGQPNHVFQQRTIEDASLDDAFNLAWHDAKCYVDGSS